MPALGHKDIRRLDVAMHDAFGVRDIHRVGNFDSQIEQPPRLHGTARNQMLQRLSLETFHRDEGLTVFFADVMDGADVGVIQSGRGFGFPPKTTQRLWVFGEVFG